MSTWIRDRNCFSSRFKIDPAKRAEFSAVFEQLCTFAKPYYDRGCAFAFQGWARDPNEFVVFASWDEKVVQELRATAEFQKFNAALLNCSTGAMVMEQFSGMNKDRDIFDTYPPGKSIVHTPGKSHEVVFL
jgi:quinol monooxygenase YgiN